MAVREGLTGKVPFEQTWIDLKGVREPGMGRWAAGDTPARGSSPGPWGKGVLWSRSREGEEGRPGWSQPED